MSDEPGFPTPEEEAREQEFTRLADQVGLQLRLGHIDQAWRHSQDLLKGWPASTTGQELAGDVALAQGKVALAREHYQQALELEPANADAERKYGLALVTQTPEERRQAFLEGVIADPTAHRASTRKPLNAVLNALLFPGLGQLYNRQHEKGLAFVAGGAVAVIFLLYLLIPYASASYAMRAPEATRAQLRTAQEALNEMGASHWLLVALAVIVYVGLYMWGIYDAWRESQSDDEQVLGI